MQCPNCQVEVVANSIFCHQCGARLTPDALPPASPANGSSEVEKTPAEKLKEALAPNAKGEESEHELWRGGYSPRAMIGNWILSGSAFLVLTLIALIWFWQHSFWLWLFLLAAWIPALYNLVVLLYRRMSVRYFLTNQRFIHESGILRRVTNRIEVLDMDDISFEQGFVERLLGVGTICIHSTDVSHPVISLRGIENVTVVSNLIDNTRRSERRRRGLHIENI